MNRIEVSIIIPTYNYGRFIEETLKSILSQTFNHWECIIVDNGSTDNTEEIVKTYIERDKRIKYISIKHTTTSGARNVGIKNSIGSFIQFLDSDDLLCQGKLEIHYQFLNENREFDIVYSPSVYFDDGDTERKNIRRSRNLNQEDISLKFSGQSWEMLPKINNQNIWTICSPMLRKSILDKSGIFNPLLNWVEDWEFYFRVIALNIKIKFIENDNSLCLIRVHQRSLSHQNLSMFSQGILARKFNVQTIYSAIERGFIDEKKSLLEINQKQIIYLYKLKYNYHINLKEKRNAFQTGLTIAMQTKDWLFALKLIKDFSLSNQTTLDT
jgi:glycosyltransferase involved in cell wall biosynthesis